jgi:PAS domain S-box-containing protein
MSQQSTVESLEQRIRDLEAETGALRREVEREQEDARQYRILFGRSRDAVLIIENQRFVDCNQAALDMLGYPSRQRLLSVHPSDLSPPFQPDGSSSYDKAKEMMEIAVSRGSHRFEWNHVRACGEVFPVEVLLTTLIAEPGLQRIHTTWRDITERRRAEAALETERRTLASILEHIPQGVVLTEISGVTRYVNPEFTRITGYRLEDIPTKQEWFARAYPDNALRRQAGEAWEQDTLTQASSVTREFRILCGDGHHRDVEFISSFVGDRVISVVSDVTRRRQEEELRRERERLQGVLELSGAVCHEMNQPLMNISGCLELMRMDVPEESPLTVRIAKMEAQLNRMKGITRRLMEISRYETKAYPDGRIVDLARSGPAPPERLA